MARKVILALLGTPAIHQVFAVTASEDVAAFAGRLGAGIIRQPQDRGTRSAFAYSVATLMSGEPARRPHRMLMIAGDIPLITPAAVGEFLNLCHAGTGVALVPDQRWQGTNALLCSPPDAIEPCFGEDSLRRHRTSARLQGLTAQVIESRALSLDIDVLEDLDLLTERLRSELNAQQNVELVNWLSRCFAPARVRADGVYDNAPMV